MSHIPVSASSASILLLKQLNLVGAAVGTGVGAGLGAGVGRGVGVLVGAGVGAGVSHFGTASFVLQRPEIQSALILQSTYAAH